MPLLPILGFLRDYFGISGGDSAADARARIAERLAFGPEIEADLGLLFDFMEVPDPERPLPQLGPEARRGRVLEVFARITAVRTEQQTLLLILEDLHWFDPHSVEFLGAWLPSFPGTRTLIVMNFRPEFHAPWMGSSYYRQLPLAPLDGSSVLELLDELLGPDPSLTALTAELRSRTGGNPFFTEEIVRGLSADGSLAGGPGAYRLARPAAEVKVPATVQAVLAGRIDRLAPRDKAVLQGAAVIGRTFSDAVLRSVVEEPGGLDDALRVLCTAELLQRTGADGEYRFWHPLTQEVAYGGLLATRRRALHQRVGEALIANSPDRLDELAAVVATHFEAAGDDLAAAHWQVRAGLRAFRTDVAEALRRMRAALDHATAAPETEESLRVRIQAAAGVVRLLGRVGADPAEVDRLLDEIRPEAARLGDPAMLVELGIAEIALRFLAGEHARCVPVVRELSAQTELIGDRALQAWASVVPAMLAPYRGSIAEGRAYAAASLALCDGDPLLGTDVLGYSIEDWAHLVLALLAIPGGPLGEAAALVDRARARYTERPYAEWRAWTLTLPAHVADLTGEPSAVEPAAAAAREALQLARESANWAAEAKAGEALALIALLEGRPKDAAGLFEEVLVTTRKRRAELIDESRVLAQLARAQLALGDPAAARRLADEAVVVARRQGAPVLECFVHLVRARVYRVTATGTPATPTADLTESRAAVRAGEELVASTGAATYSPFLAEELARLDDDPSALKACVAGYDAIGATGHARRLRDEIGQG